MYNKYPLVSNRIIINELKNVFVYNQYSLRLINVTNRCKVTKKFGVEISFL